MSENINKAKEKLSEELKSFLGDQKAKAISSHVEKTLKEFCKDETFAKSVEASKKTLSDCCKEIMSNCGNYVSDLEVYKKAAQFYFPGAKVDFTMSIKVDGVVESNIEAEVDEPINHDEPVAKKSIKKEKSESLDGTIQISLFA